MKCIIFFALNKWYLDCSGNETPRLHNFLWLHLQSSSWLSLTFYCVPWADPGSLASAPWVAGLRNKIPARWVENIQIFFCPRQRMSRGVGAVRLKMGLSFRIRSLNPQKHSLGRCEPLGILWERAYCILLSHHFSPHSLSPPRLPPFISRWAYYSPLHACISASLKWGDLRTPFSFHSSKQATRVTFTFADLELRLDQSSIDFVSHIYSKILFNKKEAQWCLSL